MIIENQRSLVIQYDDLIQMDGISVESELADTLMNEPRRMINIGGRILKETIKVEDPDFHRKIQIINFLSDLMEYLKKLR